MDSLHFISNGEDSIPLKFSSNEICFLFILYCKLVITYNYSFMFTEFLFLFFFLLNCSLKSLSIISILFHAINILWMNLYEISGISFSFCFRKNLWYVSYLSTRPRFRLLTQCETITFGNKHSLEMKSLSSKWENTLFTAKDSYQTVLFNFNKIANIAFWLQSRIPNRHLDQ